MSLCVVSVQARFYFSGKNVQENNCLVFGLWMFRFVRNCQDAFQSGRTILHAQQQWLSGPVLPHPHWCLVSLPLFILVFRQLCGDT